MAAHAATTERNATAEHSGQNRRWLNRYREKQGHEDESGWCANLLLPKDLTTTWTPASHTCAAAGDARPLIAAAFLA